jgi:divalent metal cation (Fe/Co/Zn/Cd) transporter
MSRPHDRPKKAETSRDWLAGLAVTITTLVCLFGFWRLAPGTTFIVAIIALAAMIISFWIAGKPD